MEGKKCIDEGGRALTNVIHVQVCTEGRLILEFAFDDLMRIKTWHFTIRQYRELIPRSILAMHVSPLPLTSPFNRGTKRKTKKKNCLKVSLFFLKP